MVFSKEIIGAFSSGGSISGLTKPSLGLFLSECMGTSNSNLFIALDNEGEAFSLYGSCLDSDQSSFVYFPSESAENRVPGFGLEGYRFRKEAIVKLSSKRPVCCIGTAHSFSEKSVESEVVKNINNLSFRVGEEQDREGVVKLLVSFGYKKTSVVSTPGTFSSRGDILDVFPLHFNRPFRISFNYNIIDLISLFDPTTQLATKKQNKITLRDYSVPQAINNISLTDSFPGGRVASIKKENGSFSFFMGTVKAGQDLKCAEIKIKKTTPVLRAEAIVTLGRDIGRWYYVGNKKKVVGTALDNVQGLVFLGGAIQAGFYSKPLNTIVVSENDIFSSYIHNTRWSDKNVTTPKLLNRNSVSDMTIGEHIVHKSFGVGLYRGVSRKTESAQESVEIEYKNNTRVFVSLDQLSFLHKYIGSGKKPSLSTVGAKKWKREITKTKESIALVVQDLVGLYSTKTKKRAFSYVRDNELEGEPSSSFSFVETRDQKRAIKEVLSDLNKEVPMDRLICGDVGFGKTEVAIRAIFKAFLSDRVSVMLCPTTILADQHYITCKERLGRLGIEVSLLSRFKTKKDQSQTIKNLKENKVDVLLGTHRLLSRDVVIPRLGLLIIDEEHRFGVKHKEQIRLFKKGTDVLPLTATPIPRTLQQSLVGLKKISTISTPPKSRKPIFTSVRYFDWQLIFERIESELARGGQVYFLNNDIGSIPYVVEKVKKRFRYSAIEGASGKMASKDLEKTILKFFNGGVDVLVCTTIIESGLDVTNANTVIINNAQNFGLSQLYQIRGRVGRGGRQASCLLLIPKKKLEKSAKKRLQALEKNTALGSGYNISMSDLEIRGAGSLFGHKQSGHISTVGFQMYCDLLDLELKKAKNPGAKNSEHPIIKTALRAQISEEYIEDSAFRIDYYYRISCAKKLQEVSKIEKELVEIFGELPTETKRLLLVSRLRVLFSSTPVIKIAFFDGSVDVFIKNIGDNLGLDAFLRSITAFVHDSVAEINLQPEKNNSLKVSLVLLNGKEGFNALFSFVRLFDKLQLS